MNGRIAMTDGVLFHSLLVVYFENLLNLTESTPTNPDLEVFS